MKKIHFYNALILIVFAVFFVFLFQKITPQEKSLQIFDVFDTYSEITVFSKNSDEVLAECNAYLHDAHQRWSSSDGQSEIGLLNSSKSHILSFDTIEMLEKAHIGSRETNGYFDVTIGNIINLWDFKSSSPKIPDTKKLKKAIDTSGYEFLEIDNEKNLVTLNNNISVNLGGIAKGYATDKLVEIFKNHHVPSALINLGGNVYAHGKNTKNKPYSIGIADPKNPDKLLLTLLAADTAVVTSGSYQRYFEIDSVRYHHILNPFDGMSANSGLLSVTIVSPDATTADILSTAFFVMGYHDSLSIMKKSDIPAIFVTENNEVYYSDKLSEAIKDKNPDYEFIKID